MIMNNIYCPFCGKGFSNSAKTSRIGLEEELLLHISEHHHITVKRYYAIQDALSVKHSLNEIRNAMKEAIEVFGEELESLD